MIVLDHLLRDTELSEDAPAVGLGEEPTLIAMGDRFDEDGAIQPRVESSHSGLP
jgi:hypothetical protein